MKKYIKLLLLNIGLFIALILIINTSIFDEKLNPEIVKILEPQAVSSVKNNAYYAIMGMNAAANKKPIETGWALIERYQQNRNQGKDALTEANYEEILGVKNNIDKPWLDKYANCNSKREEDCLLKLSQLLITSPIDNPRLNLMLNRYENILDLEYFANFSDISYGTPFLKYHLIKALGSIKKSQLYNLKDKTAFLRQVQKENKFLKMVLRDGVMIIDKMVAQAHLRHNMFFLSSYLRNNWLTEEQSILVQSILTPLTNDELDISNSYISESRTIFKHVNSEKNLELGLGSLFFQQNAYNNLLYKHFTLPNVALSKMPSDEIYQTINIGYEANLGQERKTILSYSPFSLYNFNGKREIANEFCLSCWEYAVRTHDLNNIISLVKLQLEIKNSKPGNIQMAVSRSSIKNNYTHRSFDHEAKDNIIKFECLDTNSLKCMVRL